MKMQRCLFFASSATQIATLIVTQPIYENKGTDQLSSNFVFAPRSILDYIKCISKIRVKLISTWDS